MVNVGSYNSAFVQWIGFCSGIAWIPYSLLLLYLTREHWVRHKFPQNIILLLLALSTILRCVWLFLYGHYGNMFAVVFINRCSMLLQFSALSILMLMWVKALEITALARSLGQSHGQGQGAQQQQAQQKALSRWRDVKNTHSEALLRLKSERKQALTLRLCVAVNAVVWLGVLASLAMWNMAWYAGNIFAISFLCLCEALITLVIGLRTAVVLQRELSATTLHLAHDSSQRQRQRTGQGRGRGIGGGQALRGLCVRSLCAACNPFYRLFFSRADELYGLQIQRDVVRTILSVSAVVFVFFFIRAFAFICRPLVGEALGEHKFADGVGMALYPLFFYQLPDLLPNLAIALGIAPPKSLIRVLYRLVTLRRGVDGEPHPLATLARCLCGWRVCVDERERELSRGTDQTVESARRSRLQRAQRAQLSADNAREKSKSTASSSDNFLRRYGESFADQDFDEEDPEELVASSAETAAEPQNPLHATAAPPPERTMSSFSIVRHSASTSASRTRSEHSQRDAERESQQERQRWRDDEDDGGGASSSPFRTSSLFNLLAAARENTPRTSEHAAAAADEPATRPSVRFTDGVQADDAQADAQRALSRAKDMKNAEMAEMAEMAELIYEIQSLTTSSRVDSAAGSLKLTELLERASGRSSERDRERESGASTDLDSHAIESSVEQQQRERENARLKNDFVGSRPWNRKFWL